MDDGHQGLTLDTGALIALENKRAKMVSRIRIAIEADQRITVPAPVLVEWYRGQTGHVMNTVRTFQIEPLSEQLAYVAGLALGKVASGPSAVDAVVMASAAQRGDIVYTSDIEDMEALQGYFRAVRVLRA